MEHTKHTTGFVVGKFLPLHTGHELLISFAANFVDTLYVIVDNIDDGRYGADYIDGEKRVAWIKERFPKVEVVALPQPMPQDPGDTPDFWPVWLEAIEQVVSNPDYVFVSDSYGEELAKRVGCTLIPFDQDRGLVSISATNIREDLKTHWDLLASTTKPDYLLRIAIVGPESSGKSTLTKELATQYQTIAVPEYARLYLERLHGVDGQVQDIEFTPNHFWHIVHGHMALEQSLKPAANRILFSDTDPLLSCVWYEWIRKEPAPDAMVEYAINQQYDLYVVAEPDLAWEKDSVRYDDMKDARDAFFAATITLLEKHQKPYITVSGKGADRLHNAVTQVDEFYQQNFTHSYFVDKLK